MPRHGCAGSNSRQFQPRAFRAARTTVFAGFAVTSMFIILDYFMARHWVSSEGIRYRKLLGTKHELRWGELQRVYFSPGMKWFVLEGGNGSRARISVMLRGLPEFARLLMRHAPPEVIEPETLSVLRETAVGRPPSVWG